MKTLVVYYSLGGTTRQIAHDIASELDADLSAIVCTRYGPGAFGYMRAGFDAVLGSLPKIRLDPAVDVAAYDCVVLGSPIWVGKLATPLRRLLRDTDKFPAHVALFMTSGGQSEADGARAAAQQKVGHALMPVCMFTAAEIKSDEKAAKVAEFARELRAAAA